MVQYLLNATAIWLVSLVVFDMFLKKHSHHGYNRAYLFLTFLAGLLLPLWQWQERTNIDTDAQQAPTTDAVALLKHNVTTAQPVQTLVSFENVLLLVYAAGVAIGVLLLLRELFLIAKLYRGGLKSREGIWQIVETGKKHSPFSAFNIIFISSREDYAADDLQTIMIHEQRHVVAYHIIDLMLMQLGKVALWFHPLVYVYHQRLMMVHEYQADQAAVSEPGAYGKFLLEQAMLHRAPGLTHSFNRSPIKNRIAMLTRSSYSHDRFWLPLPLVFIFLFCFTKNSFSGERKLVGNKLTLNGNVFEMKVYPPDTVYIMDPMTGEEAMKVARREPSPVAINGEPIYQEQDVVVPVLLKRMSQNEFKASFAEKIKNILQRLKDGNYTLHLYSFVVDKKGNVAYYEEPYIQVPQQLRNDKETESTAQSVRKDVAKVLADLREFEPAMIDGKPVAAFYSGRLEPYKFEVKNHVVTLVE